MSFLFAIAVPVIIKALLVRVMAGRLNARTLLVIAIVTTIEYAAFFIVSSILGSLGLGNVESGMLISVMVLFVSFFAINLLLLFLQNIRVLPARKRFLLIFLCSITFVGSLILLNSRAFLWLALYN